MNPELVSLLRDVGAIGIVAFIIWYDHTRMIPGIIRRMSAENQKAREDFAAMLREQRDDFRETLRDRAA